jgi:hypothetical protein
VWLVDSAVRWRRNGAGGLKKNRYSFAVVSRRFLAVLQFAVLREPQPPGTVDRHFGFRRARCSAGSVRSVQEECTLFKFASSASVGAVVVFVPKSAGRVLRASAGRGFGSHG